jgi:proline iminopeptidase
VIDGVIDVDGARLHYRDEGRGPTCLVLGSSTFYPRVFTPDLREHLRLVFVDLRHFSPATELGPHQVTRELYSTDIDQVRETLGLDEVVVIGHSVHAGPALDYAHTYPERVKGVVVVGCAPHDDETEADRLWDTAASAERKELLARRLAELTPEVLASLSTEEVFVREYLADGPRWWFDPRYDASQLWKGVRIHLPLVQRLYDLYDFDAAELLLHISAPALIAVGRYDFNNPYTLWDENSLPPRHEVELFERSGHYPSLEEPYKFNERLVEWVDGLTTVRKES